MGLGGLVGDGGWVGCCSVGFALWFGWAASAFGGLAVCVAGGSDLVLVGDFGFVVGEVWLLLIER